MAPARFDVHAGFDDRLCFHTGIGRSHFQPSLKVLDHVSGHLVLRWHFQILPTDRVPEERVLEGRACQRVAVVAAAQHGVARVEQQAATSLAGLNGVAVVAILHQCRADVGLEELGLLGREDVWSLRLELSDAGSEKCEAGDGSDFHSADKESVT